MKKFAICCLALVAVAMFVPSAQAVTKCYHLTNFCDGVQVTNTLVGGVQGTEIAGLWDWICLGAGTGSLMSGGPNAFGTQPLYPFNGGTGAGFSANFKFKPATGVFDLYATFDGVTAFAFQTTQPFTVTKGACNPLKAQQAKPRTTVVQ
jgi:hypothetical protein